MKHLTFHFATLFARCVKASSRTAVLCTIFALVATARADITMPALSWTPSNNKVSISGNIATIALPGTTKQSGYLSTPLDMSAFTGKAFDLIINASVEGVGGLTYAWEGLKFQFSFHDDLRGVDNHIDGSIPQKEGTTAGWEQLRIHFDPSKYSSTSGTLTLGIQSAYGTARYDLSTLAIHETPAICEATNQNLVVSYPARIRDLPQRKGFMSPTGDMNEGDFRTLGAWGATLLRFQMANCPSSAITNVPAYQEWVRNRLDHLENVILPTADKYGLLVVVDLHNTLGGRLGGYSDFALMDDDVFYGAWIDIWREIATRFKGDRRIYGYDLCNEPNQGGARKRNYWQIQESAAEAIRAIDPDATIVMEADAKDAPDAFFYLSPLSLDNVVYQVHMYEPGTYTHQGLESNPYGQTYPGTLPDGTTFDKAWLRAQLAPVRAFQQKHHVRILVGEFSAICWAPGAEQYLTDLADIINEYGWDWCYHAFREWGGWSLEHHERNAGEPTQWDFVASPGNARMSAVLAGLAASADAEAVSDYLRLESGRTVTLQNATNDNVAVIQRIVFAGGSLRGTSFNGRPLCTANGARWRLESEDGAPILIGDIGVQRLHWHTGDGFVETRGNAQVVLYTTSYHDTYGRGIVWFDDARTAWDHTGNFVLSNAVQVVCRADNCLPHGNGTGGIRMTWVNRKLPAPVLDLGGRRVAVNEINSGGGILTNSAATRATLRFGENDLGGLLTLGTSQDCGNIDIEKTGSGQNGLDVGSSSFGAVSVEDGRFLVRGAQSATVSLAALSVAADAKFIVTDTTVHVGSYSPAGTIQLNGTGRLLYDTLVVAEGAPLTLDATEDCVRVLLRDKLTLVSGGNLASPFVEVDGLDGGLVMDGGTFPSSSRLRLADGLAAPADGAAEGSFATVLTLCAGTTTLQCATNANPAIAARILFDGGFLRCTSFSGKPLCSANGGKWILEGTPPHPIRFGNLGLQRMNWLTGNGSIETRGDCDVVFDDSNYNREHDYRGTIWLNTSNTIWNNTGDLVLSNAIHVICRADDCLPAGPQTGVVRMKWVNRGLPAPILDLNGHSVAVNGIDMTAGGIVTNSALSPATLRIGENGTSGQVTLPALVGVNVSLVKRGAETNSVTLGSSEIAALRVEEGTLIVTGASSDTLPTASITVAEGARLVVDGLTLTTSALDASGVIERTGGGDIEVVEARVPWFSASASTDTAIGGSWRSKPDLRNGSYSLSGTVSLFAAHEGRLDLPRVEATVLQDDAWPVDALNDLLADAVARGTRARFVAVREADDTTLSWRGLVAEGNTAAWKTLLGIPVAIGAACRVAAEFDFSAKPLRVSYLVAADANEPLVRLHDALGATWFSAAGRGKGLDGRVEVSGYGDIFALEGTAASDALPPPPPSPATVIFVQ